LDQNIKIMAECHDICVQTMSHCLEKGGEHTQPQHITLLLVAIHSDRTSGENILYDKSELPL
jgi:hypothetical protein